MTDAQAKMDYAGADKWTAAISKGTDPTAANIQNLARCYKELRKQTEWRPIETAPRDGTWIIAASDELGVCIVQHIEGDWYGDSSSGEPIDDLTHWLPLPTPPNPDRHGSEQ